MSMQSNVEFSDHVGKKTWVRPVLETFSLEEVKTGALGALADGTNATSATNGS